jgi:hypothetical protein
MDYLPWGKVTIFGRYSDAPSSLDQRAGGTFQSNYSNVLDLSYRTQSLTLGSNQALTPRLTNEVRFNYSRSRASSVYVLDNFGGAVPPPDSALYPYPSIASPQNSSFEFLGDLNPYGLRFLTGKLGDNLQQQFNVTDNVSWIVGAHQLKFGLDSRRLSPDAGLIPYLEQNVFTSLSNLLANKMTEA